MKLKKEDIGACWNNQLNRLANLKSLGFYPKNVLDIGAYYGYWSQVVWHLWPDAVYTLIEGNKQCEEKLKNTGFEYHIALLSDCEKTVDYFLSETGCGEGNSIYPENSVWRFDSNPVKTKSLGDLMRSRTFDFVKIDCQGSELDIIKGGLEIIYQSEFVQLECQIQKYNSGAPMIKDVVSYMNSINYDIYDICDFHYSQNGTLIQTDLLFCKKTSSFFNKGPWS